MGILCGFRFAPIFNARSPFIGFRIRGYRFDHRQQYRFRDYHCKHTINKLALGAVAGSAGVSGVVCGSSVWGDMHQSISETGSSGMIYEFIHPESSH